MILLPLKENAASAPWLPAGAPRYVAPSDSVGVLDQHDLVAGADVLQRVVVAALAVQVDGDHGADRGTGAAPLRERAVEQARVDRPGLVTVDEDRRGARVHDRVRARGEGEVRAGDLVARADSEHDEREVERGGPARQRDRMLDAGDLRELRLERVDVRPERRDPVRCDRLGDELGLPAGEVGRGEVDARHRARA